MNAVILDIDGTLVESNDADGALYMEAVRSVLGPVIFRDDWGDYRHVTDSGILDEVLRDNELEQSRDNVGKVQAAFFELLSGHLRRHGAFPPIPGAVGFVEAASRDAGIAVAYATGGWRGSAMMKLEAAGFPLAGIPLATSDDALSRVDIMLHVLGQLGREMETVTYYGDGEWDRTASRELGWRFQPVGERLDGIKEYVSRGG